MFFCFFFVFPLKGQPGAGRMGEGREGHYVQNTRNTKGDRSTHILEGWGQGRGGAGGDWDGSTGAGVLEAGTGPGTLRGDILLVSQLKQLCSGRSGPVRYTKGI